MGPLVLVVSLWAAPVAAAPQQDVSLDLKDAQKTLMKVYFGPKEADAPPLCPNHPSGVVRADVPRARPAPVHCVRVAGDKVFLSPSGYEVFPSKEPKLLVKGFAPKIPIVLTAVVEPFESAEDLVELGQGACAMPGVFIAASERFCVNGANVARITYAVRAASRVSDRIKTEIEVFEERYKGRERDANAFYFQGKAVKFNAAMVYWFGADDGAVAFAAAHEFGHALQDVRGQLTGGSSTEASRSASRVCEGFADAYAWAILRDAGFDAAEARAGMLRFTGEGGYTHPVRWDRLASAQLDQITPEPASRCRSVACLPQPRIPAAAFDSQGRASLPPSAPEASLMPAPAATPATR